ncbi:peptidyl-prolyl cis-trans isomerase SurA [Sphingomonas kaistensis]|uniref:Parvulin-like PPIase n=1 Tax=Sphingomonas kaistensis TaxID=298708 RepID=A0A7X5Y723_9SPHN|nr:peptidylprolyl isomerase [Sphingomonas kaistensis]NJC05928.1 peptidyl-prolyl cis-trans isomerase SurA [Sphingomonas kaistensis]
MAKAKTLFTTALIASLAGVAAAQVAPQGGRAAPQPAPRNSTAALNLPQTLTVYGRPIPAVVKASAIVNGRVITQTDIDQRLALLALANNQPIPADEEERLRVQVLRNLIDETLQIQAAEAAGIKIGAADIDRTVARVADGVKRKPAELGVYLKENGSSLAAIRRQIEGEIAWQRLQRQKIESQVSVGDDEVKAVIERLNASKGAQEYRVGEIYLEATAANQAQVAQQAQQIVAALRQGASFAGYARQYGQSSAAAVGGDLGWVRPEQLPEAIAQTLVQMQSGQLSQPIPVPGGVSIIAVQDTRKVLTADPRNAVLSLKQVSIGFPAGTSAAAAEPTLQRFAAATQNVGGCGGADKVAAEFKGEVVQSDSVKLRDLPAALQDMMLPMQVGQATRPFGSINDGVRVLVICGRDEEQSASAPNPDAVFAQLQEERVNLRARRYLRDLRRDAVIDYR